MVELEPFDMEAFIAGCDITLCQHCGAEITQNPTGRPKKFCSASCRNRFWKAHPRPEKWDSYEKLICPVCGRMFFAAKENTRKRKYCSRACANRGRGMKGGADVYRDL